VGPCHHGMARPQVADGGTASNMGGGELRIYRISIRGQPTRGGPPALGLGEGLTTTHRENVSLLRNIHTQSLGHGLILWYELSNERVT
jgi:hypothetical protein